MRSIKPTGIKFKVEGHRCNVIVNESIIFIRNRRDKYSLRNSRHLASLPLVSRQVTCEKRAQKFHTDDTIRHYPDLGRGSGWLNKISYAARPIRSSDASSVWNFCARFSDVIWRETSGRFAKCPLFSQAKTSTEIKKRSSPRKLT